MAELAEDKDKFADLTIEQALRIGRYVARAR